MKNKIINNIEEKNELGRFITGYDNDLYFWSIFLNLPKNDDNDKKWSCIIRIGLGNNDKQYAF